MQWYVSQNQACNLRLRVFIHLAKDIHELRRTSHQIVSQSTDIVFDSPILRVATNESMTELPHSLNPIMFHTRDLSFWNITMPHSLIFGILGVPARLKTMPCWQSCCTQRLHSRRNPAGCCAVCSGAWSWMPPWRSKRSRGTMAWPSQLFDLPSLGSIWLVLGILLGSTRYHIYGWYNFDIEGLGFGLKDS